MTAKLFTAFIHLSAFLEIMVNSCVMVPENWKYCFNDLDEWLYPELVRGWEMITEEPCIYCDERQ